MIIDINYKFAQKVHAFLMKNQHNHNIEKIGKENLEI
jgi:hypothetical protein